MPSLHLTPKSDSVSINLWQTFSPNSRWLVVTSLDSIIRTFDVPTGRLIDAFRTSSVATSISFSPTNDFLATAHVDSLGVYLWYFLISSSGWRDHYLYISGRIARSTLASHFRASMMTMLQTLVYRPCVAPQRKKVRFFQFNVSYWDSISASSTRSTSYSRHTF
jgi:WD40 repeat protein